MIFSSLFGGAALLVAVGCSDTDYTEQVATANKQLEEGQFSKADAGYLSVLKEDPTNLDAATGAAYTSMLKGDYAKADEYLLTVESSAGERIGEVKLRRAIIAQQQQEYAKAQQHALDSQTEFGLLLAAEVYLIDGEKEEALKLLKKISSRQEERAARQYIRLLEDDNLWVGSLAEAQASWALKDYVLGVRSVQGVFEKIPTTFANYAEEVLIWAGRAAVVGETDIAKSLLKLDLSGLSEENTWRVEATSAIIVCGEGKTDECAEKFSRLEESAPAQGLQDARATAAMLLVDKDTSSVSKILEGVDGTLAAHVLWSANKNSKAKQVIDSGMLNRFLTGEM